MKAHVLSLRCLSDHLHICNKYLHIYDIYLHIYDMHLHTCLHSDTCVRVYHCRQVGGQQT